MAGRLFVPFRIGILYIFLTCIFIVSAQSEIPPQVLDWQKAADESIAQNNLAQAIEYHRQITQSYPNSVYAFDAWSQIARLGVKTKNFSEVQAAIDQLCTIYRDTPQMYLAVFRVVRDCMDARNYSQAYSICDTAKTHLTSHPRAMLISGWVGMVSAHEGNFQQARQMKEAVINSDLAPTDFLEAMDNIGWGFYCTGQWDEAIDIYRQAIKRYPDQPRAVNPGYHVVQTCMAKGDVPAVRSEIRTFITQHKDNPDFQKLLCRLADQQYRTIQACLQNQDEDAAGQWTELLLTEYGQCENTFGLASKLAAHLRRQGKRQEAIEIYKNLLTQFSSHKDIAGVQDALVETYADMEDLVKAQEAVTIDIEKYPQRRELLRMITRVAIETARGGDPNKAMELTQAMFDQKPQGPDQLFAYVTKARVCVHQGKDNEAQKIVNDMLMQFKDYPDDLSYHLYGVGEEYYNRAFMSGKQGRLVENPSESLNKAIEFWQNPVYPKSYERKVDALYFTATAYLYLRQYATAIDTYKQVLDLQSKSGYAQPGNVLGLIGRCYEGIAEYGPGDPNEAMANAESAWQTVVEQYPDNPMSFDAAMRLAQVKERKGQWTESAKAYVFFMDHCGNDIRKVQTTFKLGNAYEKAGQKDLAFTAYSEYIRQAPVGDRYIAPATSALLRLSETGQ